MFGADIIGLVGGVINEHGRTITLLRTSNAPPDASTPWIKGEETVAEYSFKGRVSGAAAQYVDGTEVVASDLMIVAGTTATLNGATVDLVPQMGDIIELDGATKEIKRIVPAATPGGAAAIYRIFVAS